MISKFDLIRTVPKFILRDRNGFAMARAIEAALKYFLEKSQEGLDTLQNVDKMPEWRLDEMAWEMNCLYDETAQEEVKREWIRNAIPLYSIWGTKADRSFSLYACFSRDSSMPALAEFAIRTRIASGTSPSTACR